jgi:hypothetical protein
VLPTPFPQPVEFPCRSVCLARTSGNNGPELAGEWRNGIRFAPNGKS